MDVDEVAQRPDKRLLTEGEAAYEEHLTKKLFLGNDFGSESESEEDGTIEKDKTITEHKPIWNDDSDQEEDSDFETKTKKARRLEYIDTNLNKHGWASAAKVAKVSHSDSEDSDLEEAERNLKSKAGSFIKKSSKILKKTLNFNKVKDVTIGHNRGSVIESVQFHPTRPVLFTASSRGVITLFKVCEADNLKKVEKENYLQHVEIKKFRLTEAKFYLHGTAILSAGYRSRILYSYNILTGAVTELFVPKVIRNYNSGHFSVSANGNLVALLGDHSEVYILNATTFEVLASFLASAQIISVVFSQTNDEELYGLTENGGVYYWNLTKKGEQHVFMDKGCIKGSVVAISNNDQFLAIGSNTGFINVYSVTTIKNCEFGGVPEPIYSISNLVTDANVIVFDKTSKVMAYGSTAKAMAFRLYNVGDGTTFDNFPHVSEMRASEKSMSVAFSPNSGFVAIGTQMGTVRMYRLNHFTQY
uniref:U3 small nucleolar RNA-associated protein 18 homolog n=1 Tax=Rhabditophanes sp. KR3021 TaxID=114890 RepID=A0AC35TWF0_9BILA